MKIRPVGAMLMQEDGWTGVMKVKGTFVTVNAPNT